MKNKNQSAWPEKEGEDEIAVSLIERHLTLAGTIVGEALIAIGLGVALGSNNPEITQKGLQVLEYVKNTSVELGVPGGIIAFGPPAVAAIIDILRGVTSGDSTDTDGNINPR